MKQLLKYLCLIFGLLLSTVAVAETPQRTFQKANEAYQAKDYAKAIRLYESLLESGTASTDIYYNLGNSYFRKEQLGKSILNYERALRLSPNNEDVGYNLALAELEKVDDFGDIPAFFLTRAWKWTSSLLSSSLWSILAIFLLWLGIGGFVLWQISKERDRRKQGFLLGVVALIICLIPFFLAKTSAQLEQNSGEAILTKKKASIHTNADESSAVLYELHEGTKLKLLDEITAWKKVRLSNGEQGWVEEGALEEI